jgi:hypothetical protein
MNYVIFFLNKIFVSLKNIKFLRVHNSPKFYYYSAHDVTLNALLASFDLINENDIKWPIYGANLIIEIYKSNDLNKRNASNYSVNLYYCEQVNISLESQI